MCSACLSLSCGSLFPNSQYTFTLGKGGLSPLHAIGMSTLLLACCQQHVFLSKVRGTLLRTHVFLASKCGEACPTTPQHDLREPSTASAMQQEGNTEAGYDPAAKVLPGVFTLRNSIYCTSQLHFCSCDKRGDIT